MSLSSAINAAVSALNSQSSALAMVSNNLANSSTNGYKTTSASFSSLVSAANASAGAAGGVSVTGVANVSSQGLLTDSEVSTNIAIEGSGFFVVSDGTDDGGVYYTRNGEFSVDDEGYLTNGGYYLMGWPTDGDGNITGSQTENSLQTIDVDSVATTAEATSLVSMVANLPADAADNDTFTSSLGIYDSLGTAATVTVTWTKTAENAWTLSFSDPVSASGSSTTAIGDVTSGDITVEFNEDGTLKQTSSTTLTVEDWTTGAADSSISLDLGDADTATGLTQYAAGSDAQSVDLQATQDGVSKGSLSSISIADDGTVNGVYDNGVTRALYKIPVATFVNANGLTALSGGVYQASADSGLGTLHQSGSGGAGTIHGGELEQSATDTNTEFAKMMAAQQAYSSAAQIVTTAKSMFDALISAVR